MYSAFLLKRLPLYLGTGLICALLFSINLWLVGKNETLAETIDSMQMLTGKEARVREQTKQLAGLRADLRKSLSERPARQTAREQLLFGMDAARNAGDGVSISLGDLVARNGEMAFPFEASFAYGGYSALLRRVDGLENGSFPFFRFSSFSFKKEGGSETCRISGELLAPMLEGGLP